mgnify:CR=1 FL=1
MGARTAYLVAYNGVQLAGWSYVLAKPAAGLATAGPKGLYPKVEWETRVFQTLMIMVVKSLQMLATSDQCPSWPNKALMIMQVR